LLVLEEVTIPFLSNQTPAAVSSTSLTEKIVEDYNITPLFRIRTAKKKAYQQQLLPLLLSVLPLGLLL
jgi:hypothetical protein